MNVNISLPLDDGFLRRECPHCRRQFKWHHGPTPTRPADFIDPKQYRCPYCNTSADADSWWTREQTDFMARTVGNESASDIKKALERAIKPLDSGFIKMKVEYKPAPRPRALSERSDMVAVEPPCHPFEPIKVLETWAGELHCLICGSVIPRE